MQYRQIAKIGTVVLLSALVSILVLAAIYKIPPPTVGKQVSRLIATPILAFHYSNDTSKARELHNKHLWGKRTNAIAPAALWESLMHATAQGDRRFVMGNYDGSIYHESEPPFVFQDYDAFHIKKLRSQIDEQLNFRRLEGMDEYAQMLLLAAWVGDLWDHGTQEPSGGLQDFVLLDIVEQDEGATRGYSCEVAARSMSQAATAVGWPSRVLTVSNSGYEWNHAVTEVWSNQFSKWVLIDTDFNVVYEANGVPLSVYEVVHLGPHLRDSGRLHIRQFTHFKPFFQRRWGTMRELRILQSMRLYNYAHLDMRNDWVTRKLRSGSPAGGDYATYFTSNNSIPPILTAMRRADHIRDFNWPVNFVEIRPIKSDVVASGKLQIEMEFFGFGPYATGIEMRTNRGAWRSVTDTETLQFDLGEHTIEGRLRPMNSHQVMPITKVRFQIRQ